MVDSNKLERLPTLPPNLKRLDASINHLTSLSRQQTRLVRQLEYINLNKNHIVDVEPGTFS
jgi:Leucine-rich repeat (LRR) protein